MSLNKFNQRLVTTRPPALISHHTASMQAQANRVPKLRPVQVATKPGPFGGRVSVTKGIKR